VGAAVDKEDLHRRFRSGLTLAAEPPDFARFRVTAVSPDSPGAAAGFQKGDLLVEINGKPSGEHTLDELRLLFRTDGRHNLGVERAGKRLKMVLELKRF
jgi:C-terminal processing protease CtpA/Prc